MFWVVVALVVVAVIATVVYVAAGDAISAGMAGAAAAGGAEFVRRRFERSQEMADASDKATAAAEQLKDIAEGADTPSSDTIDEVAGMSGDEVASAIDDLTGGS